MESNSIKKSAKYFFRTNKKNSANSYISKYPTRNYTITIKEEKNLQVEIETSNKNYYLGLAITYQDSKLLLQIILPSQEKYGILIIDNYNQESMLKTNRRSKRVIKYHMDDFFMKQKISENVKISASQLAVMMIFKNFKRIEVKVRIEMNPKLKAKINL
ncbi:hypothetical protein ABPG72_009372 [Tetrahymena utriculariae]